MRTSKAGYSCRESSITAHMQLLQTTKQANCITHAKIAIGNTKTRTPNDTGLARCFSQQRERKSRETYLGGDDDARGPGLRVVPALAALGKGEGVSNQLTTTSNFHSSFNSARWRATNEDVGRLEEVIGLHGPTDGYPVAVSLRQAGIFV